MSEYCSGSKEVGEIINMKNILVYSYNIFLHKYREKNRKKIIDKYRTDKRVWGKKKFYIYKDVHEEIRKSIESGEPFLIGRFGADELMTLRVFEFDFKQKYDKVMQIMYTGAGFFSNDIKYGAQFAQLMRDTIPCTDYMGIWMLPFEDYFINKYANENLKLMTLAAIEPRNCRTAPWSSALAGKKVLAISPFVDTIQKQYQENRTRIYPGTNVLPEFELHTLRAVYTIEEEGNNRFETWFDALQWMYDEAMKIDFDVVLLGCGAYGFPLGAMFKKAGKQAIVMGGALQLMFGIKGERWMDEIGPEIVNDSWVWPDSSEVPAKAKKVENGCYWGKD